MAVVRETSDYRPPEAVSLLRGEVSDPSFLASVLADHRTVVSCLGLRRASVFPWSHLLSPPDLVRTVMGHLVRFASSDTRLVWMSAGGVGDSRRQATRPIRWMIRAGHVGTAYADLGAAERIVEHSGRPWIAVRPVTLVPGSPTRRAAPVSRYGLTSVIRRGDVAAWMLDVADGTLDFKRVTVLLGTGRRR